MELRPYQQEAREAVKSDWASGILKTLLVLPTGCHAKGEKVLLADGSNIEVENVVVGDHLLGMDGTVRTVLALVRGAGKLYQITPVKGTPFVVSEDHKLTLIRTNDKGNPQYPCQKRGGELVDVTVKEWMTWPQNRKHLYSENPISAVLGLGLWIYAT